MADSLPRGALRHRPGAVDFAWPCCGKTATHQVIDMRFEARHPTARSSWSLRLGECPTCSPLIFDPTHPCPYQCGDAAPHSHKLEHFVNCNLPDDHPDPSATHIKALLADLGQPVLI